MNKLLRGIFRGDIREDSEKLIDNFWHLSTSGLVIEDEFGELLKYAESFIRKHGEPPSLGLTLDHFNKISNLAVVTLLRELEEEAFFQGADYKQLLLDEKAEQQAEQFTKILRDANQIHVNGKKIGKNELKGIPDALSYIVSESSQFVRTSSGTKLSGEVREDAQEVIKEYKAAEAGHSAGTAIFTGFDPLDEVWGGIRKKELMFWLGFTNQGKSTCVINIAYNAMVYQGANVLIYSLEMSYENVRRMLYCIHSNHPKFYSGEYAEMGFKPLKYDEIEQGMLSPEDRDFYLNYVVPDFEDAEDKNAYGTIRAVYPGSLTVPDLMMESELLHRQKEVHLLIVDYVSLMKPNPNVRYSDRREAMNDLMKDLKSLAMNFANGEGVAVISPYQANREGYKHASQNDGVYPLYALAEYSESERSADFVASGFLNDDLKAANEMICAGIKARNRPLVAPFRLNTRIDSRFIGIAEGEAENGPTVIDLSEIDF